jgi:cation diffusion facilitator CzcD-associated flavoprotein CzcO
MPPHDTDTPVLIIGGGAAGLSTAASLARRGIRATVLERDDCIGRSWSRRYHSLKLHTIRRYSGLAYYPISSDRPRYLSKDEYAAYLAEYAEKLGLHVSLDEDVHALHQIPHSRDNMEWEVVTNRSTRRANVIVIATGQYSEANLPAWEGIDGFTGVVLHSSQYATAAVYGGQKALVVGLGNSGAEIAADLSAHGATTISVSVRTTPPIVSREMFGIVPVQLLGIALTPVGIPRVIDRVSAALRRISIGDLTAYGLGQAAWGPFTDRKPAVIDVGFVKQLKQGHIVVRPEIARFDSTDVIYADGSREAVDVVVAATGFRTGLEKILKAPGVIDDIGQPRFQSGSPTSAPGLYFIGFDETVRGQLFEINRESKRLAAEADRYLMRSNFRNN